MEDGNEPYLGQKLVSYIANHGPAQVSNYLGTVTIALEVFTSIYPMAELVNSQMQHYVDIYRAA